MRGDDTGIAALASGIGAKALLEQHVSDELTTASSFVLLLFAAFCFVAGVWRQLLRGAPPPRPDVPILPTWLLIAFNGFLVVVCLAVMIGFLAA